MEHSRHHASTVDLLIQGEFGWDPEEFHYALQQWAGPWGSNWYKYLLTVPFIPVTRCPSSILLPFFSLGSPLLSRMLRKRVPLLALLLRGYWGTQVIHFFGLNDTGSLFALEWWMHFPDEGAGGKCNKELLRSIASIDL